MKGRGKSLSQNRRGKSHAEISHSKKIRRRRPVSIRLDGLKEERSSSKDQILNPGPLYPVESLTAVPEIDKEKTDSTDKEEICQQVDKTGDATSVSRVVHGKEEMDKERDETQNVTGESWVVHVKERFCTQRYKEGQPSDVSIYRVPTTIRTPKPEAYVPLVASFGPYHHLNKDEQLCAIDDYKLEAMRRTIERIDGFSIDNLIAEVGNLEKKIRNCYEDSANACSKDTLCWMFAMDACFILEFFRTSVTKPSNKEDNRKQPNTEDNTKQSNKEDNPRPPEEEEHAKEQEPFSLLFEYNGRQNIFRYEVMRDIIKLENQIPLFVLIKILELQDKNEDGEEPKKKIKKNEDDAVLELVDLLLPLQEFRGFPFSLPDDKMKKQNIDGKIRSSLKTHIKSASHLLDLSRRVIKDILIPTTTTKGSAAKDSNSHSSILTEDYSTPSAEKLHKAGIIFRPTFTGEVEFKGRYFLSSILYIPEITIDDDTEILLRNLIAFEECQGSKLCVEPTIISNYLHLMDNLIDTFVDVGLLKRGKVIRSLVGSDEEIAATINDLCKGITDNPYERYEKVMEKVREHFKSAPKVWLGQFRQERCSKPWYVVSLAVAALLLGMTAVQTIFSVKK